MYDIEQCFCKNLKHRRTEMKMTQEDLGEALGYSGKSVSKWECGEALPGLKTLVGIARVLKTDVNMLLGYHAKPSYYLGIDGGATKTAFALADETGQIIRTYQLGACNPTDIGMEQTQKTLDAGIREVCAGIHYGNISLFAGIAGGITGANQSILSLFFERYQFSQCRNDSDIASAVALGLHGSDGIVSIIGTGCITYVSQGDTKDRVGGYGYLFDSSLSGYGLGSACIHAALLANDGSGEKTVLSELMESECGGKLLEHLDNFYKGGKKYIASFAPLVFKSYQMKDSVAEKILQKSINELAENLKAAAKKMNPQTDKKAVLIGGLTAHSDMIVPMLEKALDPRDKIKLSVCREEPVKGALILAGAPYNKTAREENENG